MTITKELSLIAITALKYDLKSMEKDHEQSEAKQQCIEESLKLINNFENDNLEIDSFDLSYLNTVLFNYMPKNIREYQSLGNGLTELSKIYPKSIYGVRTLEELIKGFNWAMEEKKGISIYIKMPDLDKEEIITNPIENLPKKLEYYKNAYSENLELKTFNKIKIVAYELV